MSMVDGVRPEPRLRPEPRPRHPHRQGSTRRMLLSAVAALLTVLLAGTALAYWSGTGSGSSTGSTGAGNLDLTLSPGTASNALVPGATADVAVTLGNPNPNPVHVGSLSLDTSQGNAGFGVDSGHSGCGLGALHLTPSATGLTVPGRSGGTDGRLAVTLAGALAMDATADNACQGAAFRVYLTAVG